MIPLRRLGAVRVSLPLLVALTAAGLTACRDGAPDASPDCQSPGVTSDKVVAGLLYPDTGPLAGEFSAFRGGVEARLGVAAQEGGVNGRQLVYEWADDQAQPSINLVAAQHLVDDQNVFGIMEVTTAASGSAKWLNEQGIPVTGHADESVWSNYENMFSYSYFLGSGNGVDTYGLFVKRAGGTRAVVMSIWGNEFSTKASDAVAASLEAVGIPVVDRIEVTPGITNPSATAARIRALDADVLVSYATESEFARTVNLARQAGVDIKVVLAPNGYGSADQPLDWPVGSYTSLVYHPFESGSPGIARFREAMSEFVPQVRPATSSVALHGWITADMFVRGLREAGPCPTRESFIRGLRGVKSYDADGIIVNRVDFGQNLGVADLCLSFVQFDGPAKGWHVVPGADSLCGTHLTTPAR
ncbi:ABC transporter substrate-binding protein [Parafrankia sp. FMc2]|uniref:ABC transporter substrate-binding protein n=1 Tax=Parafrankia sp. FMc2 TaxID=3233196 RepID=UPI0034D7B0EE